MRQLNIDASGKSTHTCINLTKKFIGQSGTFNSSFGTQFKPGIWQMELLLVDSVIESKEVTFTENTLYSLVAIGEQSGTGNKQPFVLTVVQAK